MSYMPTVLSFLLFPLLRHCDYNAELEYSLLLLQWECRIMLYDEFLSHIILELDSRFVENPSHNIVHGLLNFYGVIA